MTLLYIHDTNVMITIPGLAQRMCGVVITFRRPVCRCGSARPGLQPVAGKCISVSGRAGLLSARQPHDS